MTAEPDLLPLPGSVADWLRRFGAANGSIQSEVIEGWFRHYARANVAHATAAKAAEIEALRAEVREAREFRDKMANAIGSDQLRRFIEKHGEPVPMTIRMQEAEAEVEALRAEVATWEGLHASEVQVRQRWQARAERLAEALRDAADDIDAGVPPEDAAAHLRARADLLRDQEEGHEQ